MKCVHHLHCLFPDELLQPEQPPGLHAPHRRLLAALQRPEVFRAPDRDEAGQRDQLQPGQRNQHDRADHDADAPEHRVQDEPVVLARLHPHRQRHRARLLPDGRAASPQQPHLPRDQPRDAASQRHLVAPASRSLRRKDAHLHRLLLHRLPLHQVKTTAELKLGPI